VALGCATIVLQDPNGGAASVHSAAAGLRVQAVGPELAFWKEQSRARFTAVSDAAAADAMELLARCEGILASAESGHALAEALSLAPRMTKDQAIVVAITGEA
jgi:tryptophan synthase beta chain